MIPQPPPGQGPIDPRGAFAPPPAPGAAPGPNLGIPGNPLPPGYPTQQSNFSSTGPGPMPPPAGNYPPSPPYPMYPPPPPPMMMPPGMFKPQRSFARVVFTTLATAVLGLSITLNLYFLAFGGLTGGLGLSGGQGLSQSVLMEGDPKQQVAVIPVTGMILKGTAERFDQMLSAAERDPKVRAIVVEVDTPGGAVTPSDEIHARIGRFRKDNPSRPVVVNMGGMATSGGYYVACAANHVVAKPTTLTGNIGVILARFNFHKLAQTYGVEEVTVTSPPNGFKNAGSAFKPVNDTDNKYFQALSDDAYAKFTGAVVAGRGNKLKKPINVIADASVYPADAALALGLIDQVGYDVDAYNVAAKLAGLSAKHVVRYSKPQSLFDVLAGAEGKGGVDPLNSAAAAGNGGGGVGTVTVNGINVNVDVNALLDDLGRPRLMYLWRGQ